MATLYEYWLFFQLEKTFPAAVLLRKTASFDHRGQGETPPQLMLKRGVELRTPISAVGQQDIDERNKAVRVGREKQAGRECRQTFRLSAYSAAAGCAEGWIMKNIRSF